jgi:hypothetical protein
MSLKSSIGRCCVSGLNESWSLRPLCVVCHRRQDRYGSTETAELKMRLNVRASRNNRSSKLSSLSVCANAGACIVVGLQSVCFQRGLWGTLSHEEPRKAGVCVQTTRTECHTTAAQARIKQWHTKPEPQVHAGVAHTKTLAKLCSGFNKPNMQTVLPSAFVDSLLGSLPLARLRGLGGQFGQTVQQRLGVTTAGAHCVGSLSSRIVRCSLFVNALSIGCCVSRTEATKEKCQVCGTLPGEECRGCTFQGASLLFVGYHPQETVLENQCLLR